MGFFFQKFRLTLKNITNLSTPHDRRKVSDLSPLRGVPRHSSMRRKRSRHLLETCTLTPYQTSVVGHD